MRNHKRQGYPQGSAIIWILVWLFGLAGIVWAGYTYAIPRYEQKLQVAVNQSIAGHSELPVIVASKGGVVTLTGQVATEEKLYSIVEAAKNTHGVRKVKANITLNGDGQPTEPTAVEIEQVAQLTTSDVSETPENTPEVVKTESEPAPETETATATAPQPTQEPDSEPAPEAEAKTESELVAEPTDDDSKSDSEPANESGSDMSIVVAELPIDLRTYTDEAAPSEDLSEAVNVTDNIELPEELDIAEAEDNAAKAASKPEPTELPTFKLQLAGEILIIEGRMSDNDDSNRLIQIAMTGFDVDVVSNGLILSDEVAQAQWLNSIENILPLMGLIKDPEISVLQTQITLVGAAPNKQAHDDIISEALSSLGSFSLVERISIASPESASANQTVVAAASTRAPVQEPETPAKPEAPIEPAAQANPVASVETETPAEPEAPVEPEAVVETETPVEPEAPAKPAVLVKAETPAEPEAPVEPEAVVETETPVEPEAPAKPVVLVKAETPEEPEAPEAVAETETPIEPEAQAKPAVLVKAETPEEPEAPVEPEAVAETETPVEPEAPAKPVALVKAETSAEPEAPIERVAPVRTALLETPAKQTVNKELSEALAKIPTQRIQFRSQANVLTPDSQRILNQMAKVLLQFPDTTVVINGHTDATGLGRQNLELSLLRATTVRGYLIDRGVSVFNLRAIGFGDEVPIANNQTVEGRAINRRIEFTF